MLVIYDNYNGKSCASLVQPGACMEDRLLALMEGRSTGGISVCLLYLMSPAGPYFFNLVLHFSLLTSPFFLSFFFFLTLPIRTTYILYRTILLLQIEVCIFSFLSFLINSPSLDGWIHSFQ
ncbi:hypothetical protein BDV23DRAFT_8875 [Aspergillus alliaceus]|uniref:Uncharacterized protein n=1 Tax=Petromyces alliaceus TaxID=209559 RepID=A0A5N7BW61_PETAA|nr:hypothetical protein BDV23DRAFT_8875 [Aspergillus alliaceus]